ncbi:MAG: hypothetical protein WCB17_04495, partial [Dehalococcoidales bacterium]
ILTEASIKRATDRLIGLKENVIIGRLIPARYKPLEEMVPAPVAALEQVLDKMDEEIAVEPEEKLDMSIDEEDEADADIDEEDEADIDTGDALDNDAE